MARTRTSKKRAQQLKQDKFRDATMSAFDRLGDRLEGRGRVIIYALIAIAALAALFGLYRVWSDRQTEQASLALSKAMEIHNAETGEAAAAALNPNAVTFPSDRERAERAIEEFQKVAAEYGSPHKEIARYFAATNMLLLDPAARAKGVEELTQLTKSGNDEVAARAKFALAQAKESGIAGEDKDRHAEEAIALYNELLKSDELIVAADTLRFRIATLQERLGRKDEAVETLFRLVEEARKAKDKAGKPQPVSEAAENAARKLQNLSPERYAQLPPESAGAGAENIPF